MTRTLPVELCRPICESSPHHGLFNLVLVSRAFRIEAERVIWSKLYLGGEAAQVVALCKHFLNLPRLFHWVHRLNIYFDMSSPRSITPKEVVTVLESLPNLEVLTITIDPFDSATPVYCGDIFKNCSFKLRYFSSSFAIDRDLASFLRNQPSIVEWRCLQSPPIPGEQFDLPKNILPNLTVLYNEGDCSRLGTVIPEGGRALTHVSIDGLPAMPILHFIASPRLKSFHACWDIEALDLIAEALSSLEYLSTVVFYTRYGVNAEAFRLGILPRFTSLHSLGIALGGDSSPAGVSESLKLACPTLRHVHIDTMRDEGSLWYDWDEENNRWVSSEATSARMDVFSESVRHAHSPPLPGYENAVT